MKLFSKEPSISFSFGKELGMYPAYEEQSPIPPLYICNFINYELEVLIGLFGFESSSQISMVVSRLASSLAQQPSRRSHIVPLSRRDICDLRP